MSLNRTAYRINIRISVWISVTDKTVLISGRRIHSRTQLHVNREVTRDSNTAVLYAHGYITESEGYQEMRVLY